MNPPAEQMSPLSPDTPAHQAADDAERLMLFNAQHASPTARAAKPWSAGHQDAGIAVLIEVSSTDGGEALVTALAERGYATVIAPARATAGGHGIGVLGLYVPCGGPKTHRNVAKRAFRREYAFSMPERRRFGQSAHAGCSCAARVGALRIFGQPLYSSVSDASERARVRNRGGVVEQVDIITTP